jgi:hypothetical protein
MMIDCTSGIYPLDAACHVITPDNWPHSLDPPAKFDIEAEVSFIGWLVVEGRSRGKLLFVALYDIDSLINHH